MRVFSMSANGPPSTIMLRGISQNAKIFPRWNVSPRKAVGPFGLAPSRCQRPISPIMRFDWRIVLGYSPVAISKGWSSSCIYFHHGQRKFPYILERLWEK